MMCISQDIHCFFGLFLAVGKVFRVVIRLFHFNVHCNQLNSLFDLFWIGVFVVRYLRQAKEENFKHWIKLIHCTLLNIFICTNLTNELRYRRATLVLLMKAAPSCQFLTWALLYCKILKMSPWKYAPSHFETKKNFLKSLVLFLNYVCCCVSKTRTTREQDFPNAK